MTREVINLTMPLVVREIEAALDTYGQESYRKAFAIPEVRQDLMAYVLSRIPNHYIVTNRLNGESTLACESTDCLHERLHIAVVIHEGIQTILHEEAERIHMQLPEAEDPCFAASHWFG